MVRTRLGKMRQRGSPAEPKAAAAVVKSEGRLHVARVNRGPTAVLAGVGVVLMLIVAGCGTTPASKTILKGTPSLTVAIPGANDLFSQILTAQVRGYFKKAHVNVTIVNSGLSGVESAAAGRVVLAYSGTPAALSPAVEGQQTNIVYCWLRGDPSAAVVVKASSPYHTIMQLAGKKVIVQGVGTASYGTAEFLSHYIQGKGGAALTVVPANSESVIDAELASGEVQAYVGTAAYTAAGVASGQDRILLSPTSALASKLFGGRAVCGNAIWGSASTIASHKTAVVRFLAAVHLADVWVATHSRAEIAATIIKSPLLVGYTVSSLTSLLKFDVPFLPGPDSEVTKADWSASLAQFKYFGLSVSLAAPQVQYSHIINMSYLNEALRLKV